MDVKAIGRAVILTAAAVYPLSAQQPTVSVDDDHIIITGCLARITGDSPSLAPATIWSKGDLMLAAAATAGSNVALPVGTSGVGDRVFYWLDDKDDLTKHLGKRVQIKGKVKDFEKGKIEIERDGAFAKVKLDLDDTKEKIRVPMSWLGRDIRDDVSIHIIARKVDVKDVDVLGSCVP